MSSPAEPSPNAAPVLRNPHFERIGGEAPITELVERFYFHMNTLPQAAAIRAMHPGDLSGVKAVLVSFLGEWMGGPRRYSETRGHPHLRRKHMSFPIGQAERDAWMDCMRAALAEVVSDAGLRAELELAFWKIADFIRNTQEPS